MAITLSSWRAQVVKPLASLGVPEEELPAYPDEFDIELSDVARKNAVLLQAMARTPSSERSDLLRLLEEFSSQGKLFYYCRA